MGRHSVPDDEDVEPVGAPAEAAGEASPARPQPGPKPAAPRQRAGTSADLQLLRADRALRARAAAAAIVPLFLYVIVMVVIARFDAFLIWVWIPVVLAGVLVGALLDRAHARSARLSEAPPDRH
jgi:hypothetical protein